MQRTRAARRYTARFPSANEERTPSLAFLARSFSFGAALSFAVSASLFIASRAGAEPVRCPSIDGASPALGALDARARLTFITHVMDDQARRARLWSTSWTAAGLGLSAGNYTLAALADNREDRIPRLVGGTTSLVIPLGILVKPLVVMDAERSLRADVDALPPSAGRDEVCATLERSERLFAASAKNEAFSAGIFTHAFAILGNGAIALLLGLGFDNWRAALFNGGGGLFISEFQIFTQPTGAVGELSRYRRADLGTPPPPVMGPLRIVPWASTTAAGIAAGATF